MKENNRCNGVEHVPTCANWPPPWLLSSTPALSTRPVAAPPPADPLPATIDSPTVARRGHQPVCLPGFTAK